jgi:hypothetical protein
VGNDTDVAGSPLGRLSSMCDSSVVAAKPHCLVTMLKGMVVVVYPPVIPICRHPGPVSAHVSRLCGLCKCVGMLGFISLRTSRISQTMGLPSCFLSSSVPLHVLPKSMYVAMLWPTSLAAGERPRSGKFACVLGCCRSGGQRHQA